MSEHVPCPNCGASEAAKVGFSWWGGFLGPKLFNHVKCQSCGKTYNGKTGKSNTAAIAAYTIVLLVIVVAVLLMIDF